MGWLIALAVITLTAVLLWKAFGPANFFTPAEPSTQIQRRKRPIIGPDDDPDFLRGINPPHPPQP